MLSGPDGQLAASGAQGVFHGDLRVLSLACLQVAGRPPEAIRASFDGPARARFIGLIREPGRPALRVERHREALADGLAERIVLRSADDAPVEATVGLQLAADLAPMAAVKYGRPGPPALPASMPAPDRLRWHGGDGDGLTVELRAVQGQVGAEPGGAATATAAWTVQVPARGTAEVRWHLSVRDPGAVVTGHRGPAPWSRPQVRCADSRLPALLEQSLDDLDALRLVTVQQPDSPFLAAGSPWFFTLFGRDSLLAAQMMLPLGTALAGTTLAVLAARQGTRSDPRTAEAPGKIMHELRRGQFEIGGEVSLPPVYYGTVDATLLWVSLLHDAWRWGMDPQLVADLLPAAERAMGWLATEADADGDGFVEYIDHSGRGLANQGWKDSGDSVRYADGRVAGPPIALAEVQGYAYRAAVQAAALLRAFDRPGPDRWLEYAAALADRFRRHFWVQDEFGPYPAIALDGDKRPADALTSNIGHLLGTGLLSAGESAAVAARLGAPDLDAGYGLRTMSARNGGYAELSYHCGSIWPHDTAIVAAGLARDGHTAQASALVAGLLRAGEAFGYRLPELYAGDGADAVRLPVPYPASCRPQAWAATAAVGALQTALGLEADVPGGRIQVRPLPEAPAGAIAADGLVVAGRPLSVRTGPAGELRAVEAPPGIAVDGPPRAPATGADRPGPVSDRS